MATTSKVENETKVTYLDFEPYCAWMRGEESDTLAVHLPGFNKDQTRVQVNSQRILTIHGQRPIIDEVDTWTRFSKHVKLPDECDEDRISAKLVSGVLTLTMPKRDKSIQSEKVISDQETKESINNNRGQKSGKCVIKRSTDRGKDKEIRGLLVVAGKVAAVVLVIAISGAYVHACLNKNRPSSIEN